jgi:hypothetical protein
MDSIMMEFEDLAGIHASLANSYSEGSTLKGLVDAEQWAHAIYGVDFWHGSEASNFINSLTAWADQMWALINELEECYRYLGYEINEWKTTDLKYDYQGEEIDTVKELEQLFWDVLTGDLKPGDLMTTIDIKEILSPYLPVDLVYPPEKFTIWVKVGDEWVRTDFTGPDWDLDLKLNLETRTAFLDISGSIATVDILQSLGNGQVKGWSYSLGNVDASAGWLYGKPLAAGGAWLISGEEYSGVNIGPYDYSGWHTRTNLLGYSLGMSGEVGKVGVIPIDIGASPNGFSIGIPIIGEVETGPDIDKPRDPTPPPYVP